MATLRLLEANRAPVDSAYPGIDAVLSTALRFIAEAAADEQQTMRARAAEIVRAAGASNPVMAADAVYRFLSEKITYKLDPPGVEEIQSAAFTLNMNMATGDCEDMVVLAAALLTYYMPLRLYVLRQQGFRDWNHILLQYHDGRSWQNFDLTLAEKGGYAGQTIAEHTIVERRFLPVPPPGRRAAPTGRARGRLLRVARLRSGLSGLSGRAEERAPNLLIPGPGGMKLWVLDVGEGFADLSLEAHNRFGFFCPDLTVDVLGEDGARIDTVFVKTGRVLFVGCFGRARVSVGSARRVRLVFYHEEPEVLNASEAIGSYWLDTHDPDLRQPGSPTIIPKEVDFFDSDLPKWIIGGAVALGILYVGAPLLRAVSEEGAAALKARSQTT